MLVGFFGMLRKDNLTLRFGSSYAIRACFAIRQSIPMVIAPFRDVQSPWTRRAPCRVMKTEWRARHGSKGRPASSCAARTAN
eukprot:8772646-Pyramimonas_sp.AAC.1